MRDELRDELQRQRERTHQLANDVVAVRLDQVDVKGRVRQMELSMEKYAPIIERLDDAEAIRKAEARRSAREAALIVGTVSILGGVGQFLVSLFTHGVHP